MSRWHPRYSGAVERAGQAGDGSSRASDRLVDWQEIIAQLDGIIHAQEQKVLTLGRTIHPGLTSEDARNPQDIEAVRRSPDFNYEDGILAGLLSARAWLLREIVVRREAAASTERRCD